MTALETLRAQGWSVAVHNDYMLVGVQHTFWLFTHPTGVWTKGEGLSDEEACLEALCLASKRLKPARRRKA